MKIMKVARKPFLLLKKLIVQHNFERLKKNIVTSLKSENLLSKHEHMGT
jgi:hypothetical protein